MRICKKCSDEYSGTHRAYCDQCIEELTNEIMAIREKQRDSE